DDGQFVAVNDGAGWLEAPADVYYNNRLWAIRGGPENSTFHDVPGYPEKIRTARKDEQLCYALGLLAHAGHIYQFVTAPNGAGLIFSPDDGRTWRNQDGSTPVEWPTKERRTRDTRIFFEEPQHAFHVLSILQMGRSYE